MSPTQLVAGVDSSTQSTKVEIRVAESGELVGFGSAPHNAVHPPIAEQEPSSWLAAFQTAFQTALRIALAVHPAEVQPQTGLTGQEVKLAALSIAGQQHGMVCLDHHDQVIRPAKLWCDTTSAPDAEYLVSQLPGGASAWAQACGSVPVAAFTISKLAWLRRNEPDSWKRLDSVLLPHDWLTFCLTGNKVTDRGEASGTGYWSAATNDYCWDLLKLLDSQEIQGELQQNSGQNSGQISGHDWREMLPLVLGPDEAAGEWNGCVVAAGTGDNMAAALGLGLRVGEVALSLGTSGTVFAVSQHPSADSTGAVAGFADATGNFLPLVCTLNATKVTDTVARLCGLDLAALDAAALDCEAGAGGLTLLPYFDGERTPNRPNATGQIIGLNSDTTISQLARAAFEGVICGLLDGLDALSLHADTGGKMFLVGGGAQSATYRQVLADLTGREVITTELEQAVATGACVQAAATLLGRDPQELRSEWSIAQSTAPEMTTTPNPVSARHSEQIRLRYHELKES
ncbi:MAG: xylulokinase [Microthrixaceae bacterium]